MDVSGKSTSQQIAVKRKDSKNVNFWGGDDEEGKDGNPDIENNGAESAKLKASAKFVKPTKEKSNRVTVINGIVRNRQISLNYSGMRCKKT